MEANFHYGIKNTGFLVIQTFYLRFACFFLQFCVYIFK